MNNIIEIMMDICNFYKLLHRLIWKGFMAMLIIFVFATSSQYPVYYIKNIYLVFVSNLTI